MIFSIVNHKGGTGKTTTAINLGSALAAAGQRVLLVDFDAQGSLSYSLGIANQKTTIANALAGETSVHDLLLEREGMPIISANETLADAELTLAQAQERFKHLKNLLLQLPTYDFILIDCAPCLSLLTINALVASDYVIVPMQMDVLALRGLDSILNIVDRLRPLNPSLTVHQEIIMHIKTNYPTPLFKHGIRTCVKAAVAPSFGKSVIQYAPNSNTARDYVALAKEMLKIIPATHAQYEQGESLDFVKATFKDNLFNGHNHIPSDRQATPIFKKEGYKEVFEMS